MDDEFTSPSSFIIIDSQDSQGCSGIDVLSTLTALRPTTCALSHNEQAKSTDVKMDGDDVKMDGGVKMDCEDCSQQQLFDDDESLLPQRESQSISQSSYCSESSVINTRIKLVPDYGDTQIDDDDEDQSMDEMNDGGTPTGGVYDEETVIEDVTKSQTIGVFEGRLDIQEPGNIHTGDAEIELDKTLATGVSSKEDSPIHEVGEGGVVNTMVASSTSTSFTGLGDVCTATITAPTSVGLSARHTGDKLSPIDTTVSDKPHQTEGQEPDNVLECEKGVYDTADDGKGDGAEGTIDCTTIGAVHGVALGTAEGTTDSTADIVTDDTADDTSDDIIVGTALGITCVDEEIRKEELEMDTSEGVDLGTNIGDKEMESVAAKDRKLSEHKTSSSQELSPDLIPPSLTFDGDTNEEQIQYDKYRSGMALQEWQSSFGLSTVSSRPSSTVTVVTNLSPDNNALLQDDIGTRGNDSASSVRLMSQDSQSLVLLLSQSQSQYARQDSKKSCVSPSPDLSKATSLNRSEVAMEEQIFDLASRDGNEEVERNKDSDKNNHQNYGSEKHDDRRNQQHGGEEEKEVLESECQDGCRDGGDCGGNVKGTGSGTMDKASVSANSSTGCGDDSSAHVEQDGRHLCTDNSLWGASPNQHSDAPLNTTAFTLCIPKDGELLHVRPSSVEAGRGTAGSSDDQDIEIIQHSENDRGQLSLRMINTMSSEGDESLPRPSFLFKRPPLDDISCEDEGESAPVSVFAKAKAKLSPAKTDYRRNKNPKLAKRAIHHEEYDLLPSKRSKRILNTPESSTAARFAVSETSSCENISKGSETSSVADSLVLGSPSDLDARQVTIKYCVQGEPSTVIESETEVPANDLEKGHECQIEELSNSGGRMGQGHDTDEAPEEPQSHHTETMATEDYSIQEVAVEESGVDKTGPVGSEQSSGRTTVGNHRGLNIVSAGLEPMETEKNNLPIAKENEQSIEKYSEQPIATEQKEQPIEIDCELPKGKQPMEKFCEQPIVLDCEQPIENCNEQPIGNQQEQPLDEKAHQSSLNLVNCGDQSVEANASSLQKGNEWIKNMPGLGNEQRKRLSRAKTLSKSALHKMAENREPAQPLWSTPVSGKNPSARLDRVQQAQDSKRRQRVTVTKQWLLKTVRTCETLEEDRLVATHSEEHIEVLKVEEQLDTSPLTISTISSSTSGFLADISSTGSAPSNVTSPTSITGPSPSILSGGNKSTTVHCTAMSPGTSPAHNIATVTGVQTPPRPANSSGSDLFKSSSSSLDRSKHKSHDVREAPQEKGQKVTPPVIGFAHTFVTSVPVQSLVHAVVTSVPSPTPQPPRVSRVEEAQSCGATAQDAPIMDPGTATLDPGRTLSTVDLMNVEKNSYEILTASLDMSPIPPPMARPTLLPLVTPRAESSDMSPITNAQSRFRTPSPSRSSNEFVSSETSKDVTKDIQEVLRDIARAGLNVDAGLQPCSPAGSYQSSMALTSTGFGSFNVTVIDRRAELEQEKAGASATQARGEELMTDDSSPADVSPEIPVQTNRTRSLAADVAGSTSSSMDEFVAPPPYWMKDGEKLGQPVFALWRDRHFYPGHLTAQKGAKFTVSFEDGNVRTLAQSGIIIGEFLAPGQECMAEIEDGVSEEAVVVGYVMRDTSVLCNVQFADGSINSVARSTLSLSKSQSEGLVSGSVSVKIQSPQTQPVNKDMNQPTETRNQPTETRNQPTATRNQSNETRNQPTEIGIKSTEVGNLQSSVSACVSESVESDCGDNWFQGHFDMIRQWKERDIRPDNPVARLLDRQETGGPQDTRGPLDAKGPQGTRGPLDAKGPQNPGEPLDTRGPQNPGGIQDSSVYWPEGHPVPPETPVYAQWRDRHFYPGTVIDQKSGRYLVLFEDNDRRWVKSCDMFVAGLLPVGFPILAERAGAYEPAIVIKHCQVQGGPGYLVEFSSELGEVSRTRSQVILSDHQLQTLQQETRNQPGSPSRLMDSAGLSLDNVVTGKRPRCSAASTPSPSRGRMPRSPRGHSPGVRSLLGHSPRGPSTGACSPGTCSIRGRSHRGRQRAQNTAVAEDGQKDRGDQDRQTVCSSGSSVQSCENPRESPVFHPSDVVMSGQRSARRCLVQSDSADPTTEAKVTGKRKLSSEDQATSSPDDKRSRSSPIFGNLNFVLTQSSTPPSPSKTCDSEQLSGATPRVSVPFNKDNLEYLILKGGGRLPPDWSTACPQTWVLVAETSQRTLKYLGALSLGVPCVSHQWVHDCTQQGRLIPYSAYLLPAGRSVETDSVIDRQQKSVSVLRSLRVIVASEDLEFIRVWTGFLNNLGCKVESSIPIVPSQSGCTLMLADHNVLHQVSTLAQTVGVPIVSTEWLIQSIINGHLMSYNGHPKYCHTHTARL